MNSPISRVKLGVVTSKALASSTNALKIEARNCVETEQRLETKLTPRMEVLFCNRENALETINSHRYEVEKSECG